MFNQSLPHPSNPIQAMLNRSLKEVLEFANDIRKSAAALKGLKKAASIAKRSGNLEHLAQIQSQISFHLEVLQEAGMFLAEQDELSWKEEADRMAHEICS